MSSIGVGDLGGDLVGRISVAASSAAIASAALRRWGVAALGCGGAGCLPRLSQVLRTFEGVEVGADVGARQGLVRAKALIEHFGHAKAPTEVGAERDGFCIGSALAAAFGMTAGVGTAGGASDPFGWDWVTMAGREAAVMFDQDDASVGAAAGLARRWVHEAASSLPGVDPSLPPDPDRRDDAPVVDNLSAWNDQPDRTVEDVLGLLDTAVARAAPGSCMAGLRHAKVGA